MTPETFASELDLAAALGRRIIEIVRRHPSVVLALPTGRTPIALYNELVRLTRLERVDWANVRTFNLDEFVGLGLGARLAGGLRGGCGFGGWRRKEGWGA